MRIKTPQELGAAVRGRRQALKLSQAKTAEAADVSRVWLSQFEAGKTTVELGNVLAVLDVLDFTLELLAPGDAPATERAVTGGRGESLDDLIAQYDRDDA